MYYLNTFLPLSSQIHLYTGNHNHHSCFYTLRTSDRNKFLPGIHQCLRENKYIYATEIASITSHRSGKKSRT